MNECFLIVESRLEKDPYTFIYKVDLDNLITTYLGYFGIKKDLLAFYV